MPLFSRITQRNNINESVGRLLSKKNKSCVEKFQAQILLSNKILRLKNQVAKLAKNYPASLPVQPSPAQLSLTEANKLAHQIMMINGSKTTPKEYFRFNEAMHLSRTADEYSGYEHIINPESPREIIDNEKAISSIKQNFRPISDVPIKGFLAESNNAKGIKLTSYVKFEELRYNSTELTSSPTNKAQVIEEHHEATPNTEPPTPVTTTDTPPLSKPDFIKFIKNLARNIKHTEKESISKLFAAYHALEMEPDINKFPQQFRRQLSKIINIANANDSISTRDIAGVLANNLLLAYETESRSSQYCELLEKIINSQRYDGHVTHL